MKIGRGSKKIKGLGIDWQTLFFLFARRYFFAIYQEKDIVLIGLVSRMVFLSLINLISLINLRST